jgi:hypothetical protein
MDETFFFLGFFIGNPFQKNITDSTAQKRHEKKLFLKAGMVGKNTFLRQK